MGRANRALASMAAGGLLLCAGALAQDAGMDVPDHASATYVLVQPTADIGIVSASGLRTPRTDWEQAAIANLRVALKSAFAAEATEVLVLDADPKVDPQIALLAETVMTVALAKGELPEGAHPQPWTLGEAIAPLAQATGADFAIFTSTRADATSAAHQATDVGIGLLFGSVSMPRSGSRGTRMGLVDLSSGDLVWVAARAGGDPRDPEDAATLSRDLVSLMVKR